MKANSIAALLAVCLSLSVVGCAARNKELSKEFREAQRSLNNPESALLSNALLKEDNEEYAEARERYREILIGYPENIDAQLGLARIENITGRKEQAEKILTSLAEKHPRNVAVQLELGRMYASREQWPDAISAMNKACDSKPEDQTARFELGLAYIRANRVNDALPHLTFAVGESAARYNIGYVMQEQGRNEEAIRWYEEALSSHPDQRTALQAQQMLSKLTGPSSSSGSHVAAYTQIPSTRIPTAGNTTGLPQITSGSFAHADSGPSEAETLQSRTASASSDSRTNNSISDTQRPIRPFSRVSRSQHAQAFDSLDQSQSSQPSQGRLADEQYSQSPAAVTSVHAVSHIPEPGPVPQWAGRQNVASGGSQRIAEPLPEMPPHMAIPHADSRPFETWTHASNSQDPPVWRPRR